VKSHQNFSIPTQLSIARIFNTNDAKISSVVMACSAAGSMDQKGLLHQSNKLYQISRKSFRMLGNPANNRKNEKLNQSRNPK